MSKGIALRYIVLNRYGAEKDCFAKAKQWNESRRKSGAGHRAAMRGKSIAGKCSGKAMNRSARQ